MARHLPRARGADAAAACGTGRADLELHHPRHRRPEPAAQAGDGGDQHRPQALAAERDDGGDPALEGSRPVARGRHARRGFRLRQRPRHRDLRRLPGPSEGAERLRLRRPAAACREPAARQRGGPRRLSPPLPLHPGGRVPGHQPGAVLLAAAARAGAPEHLLRRRRRPVDLFLARGGDREHPPLREGLPRREDRAAGEQLPLHPPHPRRRVRADREEHRPPRQDAAPRARGCGRGEGARRLAVGQRGRSPHGRRTHRGGAARRLLAGRSRDPGARRLPDAVLRGTADRPRHPLSRRRRRALL